MHMLVSFVWLFLSGNTTLGGFLVGVIAGLLLLSLFKRALGTEAYVRRVFAFIRFALIFIREVIVSNFRIAMVALKPNAKRIRGEFMTYDIEGLTALEILLLCYCVSLTPGTAVAGKSEDERLLILHAFASSPDEISDHIDETLRKPILAFTR